jgi:hypothetical protein
MGSMKPPVAFRPAICACAIAPRVLRKNPAPENKQSGHLYFLQRKLD